MAVLSLKYGGLLSKSAAPRKTHRKANAKINVYSLARCFRSQTLLSEIARRNGRAVFRRNFWRACAHDVRDVVVIVLIVLLSM